MANKLIKEEDALIMSADSKIGLLATIDDQGSPHISFISSLQPLGYDALTMGQFCEGLSKKFITERNQVGFLFFSPNMLIWRGRARYVRSAGSGPEYEMYNRKTLFRYNPYFGIGSVHYFDLVDITDREKITKGSIAREALKTRIAVPFTSTSGYRALNDISRAMFSQLDGLKFIAYLDSEGFPCLVPVIQAVNAGRDRIIFSLGAYRKELLKVGQGAEVAVFFVNLKMESVLVKGVYQFKENAFLPLGRVDITRVYNSMPPQPQYIYPRRGAHKKVVDF